MTRFNYSCTKLGAASRVENVNSLLSLPPRDALYRGFRCFSWHYTHTHTDTNTRRLDDELKNLHHRSRKYFIYKTRFFPLFCYVFLFSQESKHFFERGTIFYIPNRKRKQQEKREREREKGIIGSIQSGYHFSMDNEELYCAEQFVSHNYLTRWPRGDLRRASWNELERALENCQKRENSYPWQWGAGSSKCQHGYRSGI